MTYIEKDCQSWVKEEVLVIHANIEATTVDGNGVIIVNKGFQRESSGKHHFPVLFVNQQLLDALHVQFAIRHTERIRFVTAKNNHDTIFRKVETLSVQREQVEERFRRIIRKVECKHEFLAPRFHPPDKGDLAGIILNDDFHGHQYIIGCDRRSVQVGAESVVAPFGIDWQAGIVRVGNKNR